MFGFGSTVGDFVSTCWSKPGSRKMLIFLGLNMTFMFVEMSYGVYANSLGLISDAFHMLSDCLSIFIALVAAYISSGPADRVYTFGYERVEVLAGLFNGLFLVFVAFNVFCQSIERLYEPQYIESESLLTISVLGLLVNLIGLIFFHEHAHSGHSHASHDHCHLSGHRSNEANDPKRQHSSTGHDKHDNQGEAASQANHNLQGVFLHVLADTLGSIAVIISAICIKCFGFYAADPICCFAISFLILISVIPLLKRTMMLLVLGQDGRYSESVQRMLAEETFAGATLEIENVHVWELTEGNLVCSIKVLVDGDLYNDLDREETPNALDETHDASLKQPQVRKFDEVSAASSATSLV